MVDVLVVVRDPIRHLDPPRKTLVPVEEQCFEPGKVCWKDIACIKAAVVLELPFTWLMDKAKYGLRPEDRERLREMYGRSGETDSSTPPAAPPRMTDAGDGEDGWPGDPAPTEDGGQGSGRPTETREEETE